MLHALNLYILGSMQHSPEHHEAAPKWVMAVLLCQPSITCTLAAVVASYSYKETTGTRQATYLNVCALQAVTVLQFDSCEACQR